jgi:UDP-glucose 4-epimerase
VRTLITGGHGFLGGRLGFYLSSIGYQVILGSRTKFEGSIWLPTAENVVTDWSSQETLESIVEDIDLIIHMSGMNSRECEIDPIQAMQVNGLNTKNLIDASIKKNVKNFIYISTAHVYANPLIGTFNENSNTNNNHPYAVSHLAGEKAVIKAGKESDMNILVLRLANAFGYPVIPSVNCWNLFVNQICKQVIEKNEITLKTHGNQQRNFVTIDSVVKIIHALSNQLTIKNLPNIINIGSKNSYSIFQMAQFIQTRSNILFGFKPKINLTSEVKNLTINSLNYQSLYANLYQDNLYNFEDETDALLIRCGEWFNKLDV